MACTRFGCRPLVTGVWYYAAVGIFHAAGEPGGKSSLQISPAPHVFRSPKMPAPSNVAAVKNVNSASASSTPLPAGLVPRAMRPRT